MQTEDLQVILKVARFGSITAAAASLDMHIATASAAVKRVEKILGAELFIRSTRQLRVSAAGERFLPQCEQALQLLEQARSNIVRDNETITGEVRLAVSSDLGRNKLLPWLDEFIGQHPEVKLRIHIGDSNIDFYRDEVDMALRYGAPKDSGMSGFKICDVPGVLCAAESYLQQFGEPQCPEDLTGHNGLFYQLGDVLHDVWSFTDNTGHTQRVRLTGNRASNDGDLVRRWCVNGKGVAVKSCLDVSDDLLTGRLKALLPDYQPRRSELWLVCPSRNAITPVMRVLRDHIRQKCHQITLALKQ
ncbi:LysR family transcriptional regulator [Oceanospirillum linum]|uniref:LysR family transcriptional regulator n=1 Tax=Oceanospirillum linum TaxID=966 RepID=A0A1T1HA52_OCELI|nr:LysR family transcriptional regulator [Oceanospirillum linum]OOV86712.1 LysR family transcriptional regulator [Oceanospirillum linum]SEG25412.1 DNA-binding transcriptional regulator, LysR family [Oleiphilus messinensis]SMP28010.1 transcriptional regulator, LysR family [Oceanospirillum linum]